MSTTHSRRAIAALAALTAAALVAIGAPTAATASPVIPSLTGTVALDANANGVVDGTAESGFEELGLAGVAIDLECVADGAVLQSTTSGPDGTWAFTAFDLGAEALNCPDGVVQVRATVADDRYSITDAAGDNDTPRTADEQVGLSAPLALTEASAEVVDTLVRPDWSLDLTIPIDAATAQPAIYTGSDPFDTVCPDDGKDCSPNDLVVRSADTVTFTWAVTASSLDDLADTAGAVMLSQTLTLVDGAIANFVRIPARCKPAGGGGAAPASVIVDQDGTVIPEGAMPPAGTTSVTLHCNLGTWSQTGNAVTLQPVVKISSESPNGSSFTATAVATAVDEAGAPTAVPSGTRDYGPVDITSAPAYELEKKGFFNQDAGYGDIGRGVEPGWFTYAVIQVKTNRVVGVEALQQPITVTEDVFGFLPDGVTPNTDMVFGITHCMPNPNGLYGTVGGKAAPWGDFSDPTMTVRDSGTCTIARNDPSDLTSDYTLTFSGIDMSGATYPTKAAGNIDLGPGPYYVASYRVQVFIPYRTLDETNGTLGDETGGLTLYNRVGGFDPAGISGASNFGDGREPGYCETGSVDGLPLSDPGMPGCDPSGTNTTTPAKSDNVIGPFSMQMSPGHFAKYLLDQSVLYNANWARLPGMSGAHDGQATLQPGQVADTHLNWINQGQLHWTDSQICDVFDNTMAVLVPSSQTVTNGSDDLYAWLSATGPGTGDYNFAQEQAYNAKWIFEYAHIEITGDDPLQGGLNATSGRYDGSWTSQAAARCDDDAAEGGWFTDPTLVPGGIDEVNAVRVRPGIDPATGEPTTQDFGVNNRLQFGMRIRDVFYGGPHDGDSIPSGAVFANFGSVKSDEATGGEWTGRGYVPSPENTNTDGDRVTVSRATLALQKRTVTVGGVGDGAADFGNTGNAVAGNQIVWEVVASVSAETETPAPVSNLTITDVLPVYAEYDQDCTAALPGGTVADDVLYDTPSAGKTTLVWNLGAWVPNTPIPSRIICSTSDPLAPNGTSLVNVAQINYDGSPSRPSDTHTVTLEQTGEVKLRKTVDAPLDVLNDGQDYTLSMQNFSQTLTVGAPTIIEVFPYNGDDTPPGGVNRSPASAFHGILELAGAPTVSDIAGGAYDGTFLYTTDDPATVNQNLNANTSTWVTEAALGGDFSQVTAIKFVGDGDLTPLTNAASSGLTIAFTLQAGDAADPFSADANQAGDLYSNRFTAFSSTFEGAGGFQVLASNRVTVRTVSHSEGDLVFEDRDGDGRYTAGRDALVPDGTVVRLVFEGDDGDSVVATTTTSDGVYVFTGLPSGRYHVEIPASQFAAGGPLEGYSITVAPSAGPSEAQVDQNDDVSHDAISGTAGSIVSQSFSLSATVDPTTQAVSGDEPTGENIHGVVDPSTTDSFSNLAIDLALQRAPGIDLEKEVCTLADNSCDPEAGLGAGGWSVDGVDGIGPDSETTQRPYGSQVLWRIIVTNTGEQYLTDVEVTDPVTADCSADDGDQAAFADLAPGQVVAYTCTTESIKANITPNTATVVGTPQGTEQTLTDVDTANATTTGGLQIVKTLAGPGVEAFGAGPFAFEVVCTLDSTEVLRQTVTLTPAAGATTVSSEAIAGIPLGASCTVTETDDGGADATPSPVQVVVIANDDDNTVTADLTNRFSLATLVVEKTLDGTAAEEDAVTALEFELLVTCQVDTVDEEDAPIRATLFSGVVTITGGERVPVLDGEGDPVLLPIGAHCFMEETDDGGARTVAIDHDSFDTAAIVEASDEEQELELTATNTFDVAQIAVKKVVTGHGSAGPYDFAVECVYADGDPYPLAEEDSRFSLSNGEVRVIRILVGVSCTATERDAPASAVVSVVDTDGTTPGGVDDGIVVGSDAMAMVTITNRYAELAFTGDAGADTRALALAGAGAGLVGLGLLAMLGVARRRRAGAPRSA